MTHAVVVQHVATPRQVVLLFHGVGADAHDLVPVGQALAPHAGHVDAA